MRKLCALDELAEGELRDFEVDGVEVIVTWCSGRAPTAFDAMCPHQEISLSMGDFDGERTLVCDAHNWSFDARSGDCMSPHRGPEHGLTRYPLHIDGGDVFIDMPI